MQRRNFIKISGLAGGGLMMSTLLKGADKLLVNNLDVWEPNLFIRITPDNSITLLSCQMELGQGTPAGLAQILADELGVDYEKLSIEFAPTTIDRDQQSRKFNVTTSTGGSGGIANNWNGVRKAAAATREVLIQTAAEKWGVGKGECTSEDGHVLHKKTTRKFTFGELASEASKLIPSDEPTLRPSSDYKFIGRSLISPKQKTIVTGKQEYSIDLKLPNMAYASIERCPVHRGKLISFNDQEARKMPGVIVIYAYDGLERDPANGFSGGVRPGVVVVADSTWAAIQARKKLKIDWDHGILGNTSDSNIIAEYEEAALTTPERTHSEGDPDQWLNEKEKHEFSYQNSYQANVCMEPLNAIADVKEDRIDVWVGTQAQMLDHTRISSLTGLPRDKVLIHPKPSGGGFGRRYFTDYTEEAVLISKRMKMPIKLMWTREDTIKTNRYHGLTLQKWIGVLDDKRERLIAADYIGASVNKPQAFRPYPYNVPNIGFTRIRPKEFLNSHVSWRSVAAHQWTLGLESFMDEMAMESNTDPLEFRLKHLDKDAALDLDFANEKLYPGRVATCLRTVAEHGKWADKGRAGTGKGLAACSYNKSYCALLAEVTVNAKTIKINKVTAAIDVGMAVNPGQIRSQIEGSIIWGISALFNQITIKNGLTEQNNYDDYPLPRIQHTPEIEVHIIENEFAPSGAGEPAVPVTAPAILNAIFAATGNRIRKIPLDLRQA